MDDYKIYANTNMGIKFEYPASWTVREMVSNPTPDFDQAAILSPRVDNDIDKGAVIGLFLLPADNPGEHPKAPDEEAFEKEIKSTFKESSCKLGGRDALCLQGMNQLGARVANYIVNRKGSQFQLQFSAAPGDLWEGYQPLFQNVMRTFEFTAR